MRPRQASASALPPDAAERATALARRLDPVLLLAGAIAVAVAIGQLARGRIDGWAIGLPLVLASLPLAARLWLPPAGRVLLVALLLPLAVLALLADGVAARLERREATRDDPRPLAQAVRDFREAGHPDAVPPSKAWAYLQKPLAVDGVPTVPLSGLPNALEVLCNENGPWRAYPTDRMGFTNPDAVWDAPAEITLLGDSFTQGFCVAPEESFAARIRAAHPATINLGGGANGPLVELATLVEFQARAGARLVLWFFFEANDFDNLLEEERQPILRGYLAPGASQRLRDRLPAVHAAQRESAERGMDEWFATAPQPGAWNEILRLFKLGHLRDRLGLLRAPPHPYEAVDADAVAAVLPRVVERMAQEAAQSDARLVLVYLPGRDAFSARGQHPLRSLLLDAARATGVPVVDTSPAFARAPEPMRLYSQARSWSHLTPEGNRVVAETVLAAIDEQGWLAPP